jgi:hypothetical protein
MTMEQSGKSDTKMIVTRVVVAILVTAALGVVWFYVYLMVGLSDARLNMPRPLWAAFKDFSPFLLAGAGLAYALGMRQPAIWLYGACVMLIVVSLGYYDRV